MAEYAGEDADATWRIEEILAPRVKREGLWDLYAELERPLIGVLAGMEPVGVKVDVPRLSQLSKEFAGQARRDRGRRCTSWPAHPFNIGSLPSCGRCCSTS